MSAFQTAKKNLTKFTKKIPNCITKKTGDPKTKIVRLINLLSTSKSSFIGSRLILHEKMRNDCENTHKTLVISHKLTF